uniref:Cytochrome c-type biogenesis protein CcmH n=1 Tax=Candidatus Kentrum eta TaxID=2126337 RepID=A0A450USC8_9GAMM|nr:MAG: cytochrome c-type biogenesis protein CcmH [Candidatus Kentron sp. H]VFJ96106.1 MAG: cytochrome c-type biogenesis protein CcmH [Candidatus Kentron sp. H]VFK02164.1 MAG: cytochrome c-type biogenesis protein CcmH [Candidatus Kentron sp. H]
MNIFLLITTLMAGIGLAFVIPPLLGRGQKTAGDRKALNADIYRERLSELEQQHRDGLMDEAELVHARVELQRAALADLTPADPAEGEAPAGAASRGEAEADEMTMETGRGGSQGRIRSIPALITTLFVALAIPAAGFGLYFQWGNPDILTGAAGPLSSAQPAGHPAPGPSPASPPLADMVDRLAARLEQKPDNPEGWLMLGRSYAVMGRLDEAGAAFAEAYERQPDSPEILVSYAESLAERNEGKMAGRPSELIQSALYIDPDFPPALWLAGVAAYQQNEYTGAIEHWERLQKGAKISEQEQRMLADILSEARQAAGK